jgi:hypothetical protein
MSWLRPSRNRRSGREQKVLDVKLRSDQVRATRLRWTAIGVVMLTTTLTGFFLLWHAGGWALDYFVYDNPAFAIQKIEVQTDGVIPVDMLRRWSGVRVGQNLLALDLARVKRDLEMVSAIRSATVERTAPHTLRLRVSEREPLAQFSVLRLKTDGTTEPATVRLDREGVVMAATDWPARESTNQLFPALCGLSLTEVVPGKRIDNAGVLGALQLIAEFQHSPLARLTALQQIDVSAPDVLQVTTTNLGKVVFSLEDFPRQLRRWRDISDHARELGKAVVTLDLSVPGNIPAVLTDLAGATPTSPAPAPAPRTVNPQTTRKRNV